ncbi:MAG: 2OG-Fe(II) oxygenase [Polyangiaceae bacterium]
MTVLTIDGLLSAAHTERLLAATLAEERWFVEASTEGRDGYRSAAVLYTVVDVALWVVDRVAALASRAARHFDVTLSRWPRIEHQITASRHGDGYRPHRDDDGADPAGRALTYVYHFHRTPRRFSGGELVLHASTPEGETERVIPPRHNQLLVFPSATLHEVRTVSGPRHFDDSRFTINGWVWRAGLDGPSRLP